MKLPEVRAELLKLASQIEGYDLAQLQRRPWVTQEWANTLKHLETQMHRRKAAPRGRESSPKMTQGLVHQILQYHNMFPRKSQLEIAQHFGISSGRVSEVLTGKRT